MRYQTVLQTQCVCVCVCLHARIIQLRPGGPQSAGGDRVANTRLCPLSL